MANRLNEALQSALTRQLRDQFPNQTPQLQLLDQAAFATIQKLIKAGILSANHNTARTLYRASAGDTSKDDKHLKRLIEARSHQAQGEHKRRMAKVLKDGGFPTEALAPMREAVEIALQALALWRGYNAKTPRDPEWIDSVLIQTNLLPPENLSLIAALRQNDREDRRPPDESRTNELLARVASLLESAKSN